MKSSPSDAAAFVGYGIAIRGLSDPPDPDLPPPLRAALDWSETRGPVSGQPSPWTLETGTNLTVGWAGYAEYCVDLRTSQAAATNDGVDDRESRLAFVLSVLPLALPLFGLEPFHGSAIKGHDGAVLLLGDRGAGKSTLAAECVRRGMALLADDACAIDERGILWPGPSLSAPRAQLMPGRVLGAYNGKTVVVPASYACEPVEIERVVVLVPSGAELRLRESPTGEAITRVLAHVRNPQVLSNLRHSLQLTAAAILASARVEVLEYRRGIDSPEAVIDLIGAAPREAVQSR